MKNFKVLEFDPLLSDVHRCISLSIPTNRNVEGNCWSGEGNREGLTGKGCSQSLKKPGQWDEYKANEHIQSINQDLMTHVIDNVHLKSVSELNDDLKKILIEPAVKVFPKKSKIFVRKSNSSNIPEYDSVISVEKSIIKLNIKITQRRP